MAIDKAIDSAKLDGALTATAESIRAKTGDSAKITFDESKGFAAAVDAIQTGGGENPLDYANTINGVFYGSEVPAGTEFVISFGSKAVGAMSDAALQYFMRNFTGAKSVKVICGGTAPEKMDMNSFARCHTQEKSLERIDFSEAEHLLKPTTVNRALEYRAALKEVLGEFDMTNCTTVGAFCARCDVLETIRFKAGTIKVSLSFDSSPNLTDETIQSILDGLADLTGGTSPTLTLHATVGAKLTDEQKAAASAKNWTLAY